MQRLFSFIARFLSLVIGVVAVFLIMRIPQHSRGQPVKPIVHRVVAPDGGPIVGEKVTLEEARRLVPFLFSEPSFLPDNARLAETWVGPEAGRSLALVYSNDIEIIFHPMAGEAMPDWEAIINQPGLHFQKIMVNGVPGIGADAGVQEVDGVKMPYPGSVEWIADGVEITVYGPYPLKILLQVAESMH